MTLLTTAKGINGCFYLSIPMAALSFVVTVFFVKRTSLNRGDEDQLKTEAKAWVAARKSNKRGSDDHSTPSSDSAVTAVDDKVEGAESDEKPSDEKPSDEQPKEPENEHHQHEHTLKEDLTAAAKGMDQAAGVALGKSA